MKRYEEIRRIGTDHRLFYFSPCALFSELKVGAIWMFQDHKERMVKAQVLLSLSFSSSNMDS